MSWHYSQALVAEYSAANSSDGEPSVPLSGTPMHGMFWSPDKTMDASIPSRSGMIYKPSTVAHGEAVLMWCLAASPARTFHAPEKVQESKASVAACGSTWRESSAKYCLRSSSWKTHRCLWEEDLEPSSLTLPKWGMMRSGVLWERTTSPLPTSGTESGSWPTPRACMTGAATPERLNDKNRNLEKAVAEKLWPTPNQRDWKDTGATQGNRKSPNLGTMVHQWATPTKADAQGGPGRSDKRTGGDNLRTQAGGQLNPTWVEKLMGWPQNWTEAQPMIDFQFISWLMGFCECEKTRTNEIMRVLRNSNGAQNFQRKAGRPIGIQEAEILLSLMFQHEIGSDEAWLLMEGAEAPQGEVRGVRLQAGAASSPRRSGYTEQPAGEHPDAMQALPRLLAYDGEAAWKDQSWENAVPRVAHGVAARVDRLRCIGNGQVPAVAALAWNLLNQKQ